MRAAISLAMLCLLFCLEGCAWGIYDDKRLIDTMSEDKAIATGIKAELLKEHFTDAFSVAVYCYYGKVFLVGELPVDMREKAIAVAQSFHPRSITTCWFRPGISERGNFALAADLRAALIGAKGLSSTRVDTEVNAGRVVLLGVVEDERERKLAIETAREVKGVLSVTSYLLLPPKPKSAS